MRIWFWIKREFFHILPVFLFFAVAFVFINFTERFLFEKAGLSPFSLLEILLAAGVVAKVFLVIDHFRWMDLFNKKPLIYGLAWKTFFYWIVLISIRLGIHLLPYLASGGGVFLDVSSFYQHFDWRLFISIQGYYLMLLFIFTTARELTRVIGVEKMRKIFFGH